ncbi:MAG: pilus assembly protein, partial [Massilia sp.]
VDSYGLELGTADVPASSVLYLAAKYGGGGEGSAAWLAPGSEPVHFYPAPSPERVVGGARSLLSGAGANLGGPGPSAAWYAGATGFVIQTGAAPGTVQRHALRLQPDGGTSIATEASWDGARLLAARSPASRKLYTFSGRATLPLTWDRLPPSMRSVLNAGALGEARIAYLRGERLRELGQPNGVFRVRDGVLGDIVHSVPLIAGRAQLAVYVGANDGMLHAFSADDGRELFAYLPGATLGAIADLSNPANPARATVDGSAAVGEVALGGRTPTILAAGMGMGARGVFALDVSDPAAFGEGVGALWEFTEHDDPGMGFLSAPPQIVSIDVSTRGGAPSPRQFVLVPSAVNHLNVDANGALYMLAVDKPAAQPWQIGANYYRIGTDGADPAQANALSTPGLVRDADGKAILAYAGDLQGSLWRFDLRSRRARRIFIARDNAGRAQPIAQAPAVVYAPGGGYLVLFGTGKFIEQGDVAPTSFLPQSMYAVVDRPGENAEPVTRAQLAQRVLSGSDGYSTTGRQVSYVGPGAQQGWYLDFPNTARDGERLGGGPIARGGAVLFQTMMPSVDACAPAASRQYVLDALSGFALAADGKVQPEAITAARAVAPTLIASQLIEIGMEIGPRDATGGARVTRSFALIPAALAGATPSHDTLGSSTPIRVSFPAKRLGWREVANWQELHDAAGP